jgi:hypothetical protein
MAVGIAARPSLPCGRSGAGAVARIAAVDSNLPFGCHDQAAGAPPKASGFFAYGHNPVSNSHDLFQSGVDGAAITDRDAPHFLVAQLVGSKLTDQAVVHLLAQEFTLLRPKLAITLVHLSKADASCTHGMIRHGFLALRIWLFACQDPSDSQIGVIYGYDPVCVLLGNAKRR